MAYALLAHPVAQEELDALPPLIADGLRKVLSALAKSPHDSRFDLKPLAGQTDSPRPLRLRVGEYRVILQIYDAEKEIRIARIGHRSSVYRSLK